ncbi:MAG: mechanosensitive ion channel [Alistipes sp.]|nr:mechanosensitive ion channel [Alistipes sp.]
MSIMFDDNIKAEVYNRLIKWGLSANVAEVLDGAIVLIYLMLLVLVINLVFRWGVIRGTHWVVARTKVEWDNILFDDKVLKRLCGVVTPMVINLMLPLAISALNIGSAWIVSALHKCVEIYVVIAFALFIHRLFKALFAIMVHRPAWQGKPLDGLLQIVQVIIVLITAILIIAILINRSPAGLLAGLGASAAVISFIFKDTLMGLVAGVQLSANNMLKVGDWIEMPSRGIDGMVEEVSLTTVKVRAWNNTVQTIAPYLLVSEPFYNWQAMRDTGGRRVKRSINIDMTSVRLMADSDIEELKRNEAISKAMTDIKTTTEEGEAVTNLDLYMRVVNRYIDHHPRVNHTMIAMVRQLQPNEWGLPVELYFFTSDVNWVPYEHLQAEVISYIIALAPHFGIRLYQAPSGQDFKR